MKPFMSNANKFPHIKQTQTIFNSASLKNEFPNYMTGIVVRIQSKHYTKNVFLFKLCVQLVRVKKNVLARTVRRAICLSPIHIPRPNTVWEGPTVMRYTTSELEHTILPAGRIFVPTGNRTTVSVCLTYE